MPELRRWKWQTRYKISKGKKDNRKVPCDTFAPCPYFCQQAHDAHSLLLPWRCLQLVDLYDKIFNKEAELRELFDEEKITEEQFLERRQQKVKPLFDNLHEWLLEKKNREILETSKTKQAINYCLNRWENLTRYLNYSYLTPSTNEAERTVRPFTLLRKNSMFYGSGKEAESSC